MRQHGGAGRSCCIRFCRECLKRCEMRISNKNAAVRPSIGEIKINSTIPRIPFSLTTPMIIRTGIAIAAPQIAPITAPSFQSPLSMTVTTIRPTAPVHAPAIPPSITRSRDCKDGRTTADNPEAPMPAPRIAPTSAWLLEIGIRTGWRQRPARSRPA